MPSQEKGASVRAVLCKAFGPPEDLVVEEVDDPSPGPGEVLVEVKAAAVTFPDTLMLEDKYQYKASLPYVPGGEVAGVVRGVGDGVDRFRTGDRIVGGLGTTGGFAQLAVVPAASARSLPDGVGFGESTGLNYAYGTSLYGLKHRADLQPGETLLVLGAGGNVGLSAVELGRLMGARVIAAASSEEKLDLCRRARGRRDDQLQHREPEGPGQGADRGRRRQRGLRLRRGCLRRGGAAGDRLGRPVPGDRVHRRHPVDPAQPRPA